MPKLKTSKSAAKRFKVTGTGKLVRKDIVTDATNAKVMKKILPYL